MEVQVVADESCFEQKGDMLAIKMPSDVTIPPRDQIVVDLKFSIALPEGTVGLLIACAGWSQQMVVTAGVIGTNDRTPVHAVFCNLTNEPIELLKDMPVVQLLVQPVLRIYPLPVEKLTRYGPASPPKRQKVDSEQ